MNLPTATLARTHDVFNQSTPWADVNLFTSNHPLQDALRLQAPGLPLASRPISRKGVGELAKYWMEVASLPEPA